jgi:hypothetical protein
MSKYERNALVLGVVVAVVGLAIAVVNRSGAPFARSGAGVVVVAILFGALDLRERVRHSPTIVEDVIRGSHAGYVAGTVAQGLDRTKAEAVVARVEEDARKQVRAQVDRSIRRLLRIEFGLLIAGTLIWGFGDLPLDILFKNSGATCSQLQSPGNARGARRGSSPSSSASEHLAYPPDPEDLPKKPLSEPPSLHTRSAGDDRPASPAVRRLHASPPRLSVARGMK